MTRRSPFTSAIASDARRDVLRKAFGLGLLVGAGLYVGPTRANGLVVGRMAPPLVLHALDGQTVATRDLAGQVVIATFWATWCEPCREELPMFSAYASQHERDGLRVLGFSLDGPEALAKVRSVAATLSFPVGLTGGPYAGDYGRIWRLPVSFVIDRAGRLAHNGWDDDEQPWSRAQLEKVVDPLLSSPRA